MLEEISIAQTSLFYFLLDGVGVLNQKFWQISHTLGGEIYKRGKDESWASAPDAGGTGPTPYKWLPLKGAHVLILSTLEIYLKAVANSSEFGGD